MFQAKNTSGLARAPEYPTQTWHPDTALPTPTSLLTEVYARLHGAFNQIGDACLTVENIADNVFGPTPKEGSATISPSASASHAASLYEKLGQLESSIAALVGQIDRLRAL